MIVCNTATIFVNLEGHEALPDPYLADVVIPSDHRICPHKDSHFAVLDFACIRLSKGFRRPQCCDAAIEGHYCLENRWKASPLITFAFLVEIDPSTSR